MRRISSSLFGSMLPRHLRQFSTKEITSPPRSWCHSHSRRFLFSKTIAAEQSYEYSKLLNFSFGDNTSLFNQQYAPFSSLSNREEAENHNHQLEVEIISKEYIKPAIPTPGNLRMHELSIYEQLFPNVYLSLVYFYPNNHQNDHKNTTFKKRQILKQALSKILTKFYPLAGRLKDHRHIDCNDSGVYYVETKVKDHLTDFLKQPDNKSIHQLLPFHPNTVQSLSENHLAMVQVTEFGCSGISIGIYTSHKIMDGYSITRFLKAWSTTARASSEEISPLFVSSSMFPSNPALSQDATLNVVPLFAKSKTATRRFLFPATSLATLKKKLNSSRVLAVTGLIWNRAVAASKARSEAINCTPQPSSLTITLNVRDRVSPGYPPYSMGNIFSLTPPIQCQGDEDLGVDTIVQRLKEAIRQVNNEFLVQMTVNLFSDAESTLKMMHKPYADKNAKHIIITSICRSGTYETADFGWGKPIWVSLGNGDSDYPLSENFVVLMDTRCGKGIEAWVTLSEEDMNVLEQDPELLAFVSLNASPLESFE